MSRNLTLPFAAPLPAPPAAPQTPFQQELRRRKGLYVRVLRRLQAGPASNVELAAVGGFRYGARLHDIRQDGGAIDVTDLGGGLFSYALVTMPQAILTDEDTK